MQLRLPSRVPLTYAFFFAALLVAGEYLEGTPGSLCTIVFCYVLVAAVAFNLGRGMRYPTGSYVFFNFWMCAGIGLIAKLFLGEPVQSNLQDGRATMTIYLAGECAILVAVFLSRKLVLKKPLLANMLTSSNVQQIAIGCIVIGVFLPSLVMLLGVTSALSTIAQLNQFVGLAILVSVYQRVKETGGRSSFTWPALIASVYIFFTGITSASKQALFTAPTAWLLAAVAARYRPSWPRVLTIGAALYLMVYVFVPYSSYGRRYRENGLGPVPIAKAIDLLSHPIEVRQLAAKEGEEQLANYYHWFTHAEGFLDRLNLVCVDDPLIVLTNQGAVAGLHNVWLYFPNIIPSFLYRDKPFLYFGNVYAKEIGSISEDDFVTSVAFSPFGEAYHTGRWIGLLVVMPLILFGLFTVADSVAGDVHDSPWPLYYMLSFSHLASEGALGSPVYMMSEGSVILIVAALVSVYVTPIFGSILVRRQPALPARQLQTVQSLRNPRRMLAE